MAKIVTDKKLVELLTKAWQAGYEAGIIQGYYGVDPDENDVVRFQAGEMQKLMDEAQIHD